METSVRIVSVTVKIQTSQIQVRNITSLVNLLSDLALNVLHVINISRLLYFFKKRVCMSYHNAVYPSFLLCTM
jgi:hypothetical protein